MRPVVYDDKSAPARGGMDAGPPLVLRLRPVVELSPDQLLDLSSLNDGLRPELMAEGELIVMVPAGESPAGGTWGCSSTRQERVYVYEPGEPVRELADPVLPGFVLKPREVW